MNVLWRARILLWLVTSGLIAIHGTSVVLAVVVSWAALLAATVAERDRAWLAAAIEASAAVASVALAGWAAAPLLVAPALRTRRPLPRWLPAGVTLVPASGALVAGVGGNAGDLLLAASVLAAAAAGVGIVLLGAARENAAAVEWRELRLRRWEADRVAAREAHDLLSSIAHVAETFARELRAGASAGPAPDALGRLVAAVHDARAEPSLSGLPESTETARESRSHLVDRWARIEKTPAWWPLSLRIVWASSAARVLDSVRMLHTREIERFSLVAALLLRAAFLCCAPLAGAVLVSGVQPLAGASTPADAAWWGAVSWSLATAAAAPWIVHRILDAPSRPLARGLLISEALIAVVLILACPSWLTFVFLAGTVNWWMRPWSMRRLAALTVGAVTLFATGLVVATTSPAWAVGAEVALGLTALAAISSSFGLMWPLVAAHLLFVVPARVFATRRIREARRRSRLGRVHRAIEDVLASAPEAHATALRLALGGFGERLRRIARRKPRWGPLTRRTLRAVIDAGLDRAERDRVSPLRVAETAFDPDDLGTREIRSWRAGNEIERVVAFVAAEAVRHGEFEIRAFCRLDRGSVIVRIENDVAGDESETTAGGGLGGREIGRSVAHLRHGRLIARGREVDPVGLPVFVVTFEFSPDQLR